MIVDTSALLAFFDRNEPDHAAVTAVLQEAEQRIVSPYVVAELDYLVATRHGVDAELAVLDELAGGAWDLAAMGPDEIRGAREVIERYADQRIGIADASIVVLADRWSDDVVVTLDRRHFDVLRPLRGGRFRVLP